MTWLLDVNVLVALSVREHSLHDAAEAWFAQREAGFATCPITEGGLVRSLMREGQTAATAVQVLSGIAAFPGHEFWPDELPYASIAMAGVVGHRQVTDAYLAELARARGGTVATFDTGLAGLHSDAAMLIPKG